MKSIEPIRTNFSDEQIKELYIRTFEKIHMRKPNETENRLILDILQNHINPQEQQETENKMNK